MTILTLIAFYYVSIFILLTRLDNLRSLEAKCFVTLKIRFINKKVKYGKNVCIYPDVTFFGDGEIEIGDNVNICQGAFLRFVGGGIFIGNNTMIAAQTYIIDTDHGTKAGILIREQHNSIEKAVIEDDCWIATDAKVLKGAHLHDGCVVGTQSVVKGEFEGNNIILGVPGEAVKKRSLHD